VTAPGRRSEDGVATVLSISLAGILVVVALLGGAVVGLVDAHRRAEAAADLAALAGAGALTQGADPCAAAATIAGRNGGHVVSCRTAARTVAVVVAVAAPGALGAMPPLQARARAGPAEPGGLAPRPPPS
jgi:secretion/DNA translocation related TadE-like protein